MEIFVDDVHEETSEQPGDFYSLALFREVGDDLEGLELQRAVGGIYGRPEDGIPPYCIVGADHSTSLGGVHRVVCRGATVDLYFSDDAQQKLGLPEGHVALVLNVSAADLERVKAGLVRIFAGGDFDYPQPDLVGFEKAGQGC